MKICPNCNQTYNDEGQNFCLSDGSTLVKMGDDAPPTVMLNRSRTTNPNWERHEQNYGQPLSNWQNQQMSYTPPQYPMVRTGQDQTLPTISLILGILGLVLICCYGGALPFGAAAMITGFIGLRNSDNDPMKYGGRGLSIAGLIMGGISLLTALGWIIIWIFAALGS